MTSCEEIETMKRNVLLTSHLCLDLQKDFQQEVRLGSEIKWYSTYFDRQQRKCDRIAELMMTKFRESGHPVFRVTSPLSRGTFKSKGDAQLSHTSAPMGTRLKLFFAHLFLSVSSVLRNTVLVNQVRGDPYWQSNLFHCSRQQTY